MRVLVLLVLALSAAGCSARRVEPKRLPPKAGAFAHPRMSSGELIPPDALRRARSTAVASAPGTWTPAGPFNVGGRLTALAVDPNDPDHVWAGAAAGGVFESHDAGTTWTPVFDDQPLLNVGALAAHPSDSEVVYVGLGETNGVGYAYEGDGIYRTSDSGATWQHLGLAETRRIARIAIDPQDTQRLFVAATGGTYTTDEHRGVYRSTDGGATWTRVLFVAETAGAIDVVIDPVTPTRVYAAIWETHSTPTHWVQSGVHSGIWRSLDGGDTWTRLAGGLPAPSASIGRIGLALAASSPMTIYALYIEDPGKFLGVYKTTNGGEIWSKMNSAGTQQIFNVYSYYLGQIRVDPTDANVVYLLDVGWARSINGGQSYTAMSGSYVDHHDMVVLPDRLYQANDGGFYRSVDLGATWFHCLTLPVTQFYDLGIDPVNPLKRLGGTQDNGSIMTLDGGPSNWLVFGGSDGFHVEVDPVNNMRVYWENFWGRIWRSLDGGFTSEIVLRGIGNDRKNWSTPIVHDPHIGLRLYTGTFRVYRTIDGAERWTPISGDLTDGPPAHLLPASHVEGGLPAAHLENVVEGTITTIAASGVDSDVVWAGTDDGNVWVTPNGGSTWSRVDVPGRSEWVTRVEADPFSASAGYVAYSGYRYGSHLPRLFRTVDFGATWTDISAGLPDVPVNGINADPDPAMRGRLFAATDAGVYVSDDYGASWSSLGTGLPPVVVLDLDLTDVSRELFAGTHGRSMYVYDLDQLGPADADGDGSDNLADCRPDDAAVFAIPAEVTGLAWAADRQTLSWDSAVPAAGSATEHQVLRIHGASEGPSEVCLEAGTVGTSVLDADTPAEGSVFRYLVRARNACGTGGYGVSSDGSPRTSIVCP